jgi:hypothetical protein
MNASIRMLRSIPFLWLLSRINQLHMFFFFSLSIVVYIGVKGVMCLEICMYQGLSSKMLAKSHQQIVSL